MSVKKELTAGRADLLLNSKAFQGFRALVACERGHIEDFGSVTDAHGVDSFFRGKFVDEIVVALR